MKFLAAAVILISALLCASSFAQVMFPAPQTALPCIKFDTNSTGQCSSVDDSLSGHDWSGQSALYVGGYYNTGDGGERVFIRKGSGTDCTDNGGSVIKDSADTCWYRQNLNGNLRQWGVTPGSKYDATANKTTVVGVGSYLRLFIIPALGDAQITKIDTGKVSIMLEEKVQLRAGWSFTCGTPPVKDANNADYTSLPGSIILAHGVSASSVFIDAQTKSDVEVHDCAVVLPEWYINPAKADDFLPSELQKAPYNQFSVPASSHADLEGIRADMIIAGDTAIMAGAGANIHDIAIMGFDNCLNTKNAPAFHAPNVYMDCPMGAYFNSNGGATIIKDMFNDNYLTKRPGSASEEEYWTIETVSADTDGTCQLKLRAVSGDTTFSLSDINNSVTDDALTPARRGDPVSFPAWVTGLNNVAMSCLSKGTGRFGNDAAWATVIKGTGSDSGGDYTLVDLVGSKFTSTAAHVDTTGDWSANSAVLRIAGSISHLTPGMLVKSDDSNWPGCPSACAKLPIAAVVARATGPDPNDGYNGEVILAQPLVSASSPGAQNLYFYSVADPPAGLGNPCDGTAAMPCFFYNAAERYVAGNSPAGQASARLPASRGGHMGAGFLLDDLAGFRATTPFSFAHYYNIAAIDAEDCDFAQLKGDDHGELTAGNTVGIYVAGGSRSCDFVTQGPGQKGASIVQDTFGTSDVTSTDTGQPAPQEITSGMAEMGIYALGFVTVPSTLNWPSRGTMHVCQSTVTVSGVVTCDTSHTNEFVSYHKVSSTAFAINVRARFGTAPQLFTNGGTPPNQLTAFSTSVNNGSSKHEDKSAFNIFDALNLPTVGAGNVFEIHHGGAILQNAHSPGPGTGFVSTNTSGVNVAGAGLPTTSIVFEDGNARILTTITPDSEFANFVPPGTTNLPLTALNPGGAAQTMVDLSSLGTNSIGTIAISNNANWPQNGVLVADSEEMGFALPSDSTDTTHLVVTSRGECGTTAATHGTAATIQFVVTELPCGSAGLKGYASNGFTIGSPTGGDQGAGTLSTEKQIYENSGHPVPGVVCSSGTAHAAGTTEAILASCKIRGGLMSNTGCIIVDALWDWSASTGSKTIKVYANTTNTTITGGTAYLSSSTNLGTGQHTLVKICNRSASNSQIGGALSGTTNPSSLPTSSINTTNDWYLLFTGIRASSDTLALQQYQAVNQPFVTP